MRKKYQGRTLCIFTIYMPPKVDGPMRVYTQEINKSRRIGGIKEPIDVKEYLYGILGRMVEEEQEEGASIIIGGDFNVPNNPMSKMTEKMNELGLVNALEREDNPTPETYKHGTKTMENIGVSKDVSMDITDSGYCQYDLIINADHRGSFVSLERRDMEKPVGKRSPRLLTSKNR